MIINIYDKNTLELIAQPMTAGIERFKENPSLFFPDWDSKTMAFATSLLLNPILDEITGELREMKRVELVLAGKEDLQDGEYIEDEEIKYKEKPNEYSKWNKETGIWEENITDKLQFLKDERQKKQREFVIYKKELENLEQEKLEFEELGFDTSETEERITEIHLEMNLLKDEIAKLNKEISKIKI